MDPTATTGFLSSFGEGTRTDGTYTSITLDRKVDPDDPEISESESIQIVVEVEDEDGDSLLPSSMLMHQIWEGEREWKRSEGELPAIRSDGEVVTGVGTSEAQAFHLEKGAIEGDFEVALACE